MRSDDASVDHLTRHKESWTADLADSHGEGAGVGHQPNGATPPTQDNTVLAGHLLKGAFLLLDRLAPGDLIVIFRHRALHQYRVMKVFTRDPEDESILRCGSRAMLTLYTCAPRHQGNSRTVVVAETVPAL